MTAAVAPLALPLQIAESPAEARKRRREILTSQRSSSPETCVSSKSSSASSDSTELGEKRRKLNDDKPASKIGASSKKPQMKYDPEEPMTKEQAAVWRREQRRKRNRESAAASRQRQRDRITELEAEVEDWKRKYEATMEKINKLEAEAGKVLNSDKDTTPGIEIHYKFISPPTSPRNSPVHSPLASPISSAFVVDVAQVTPHIDIDQILGRVVQEHSDKMISRQAET